MCGTQDSEQPGTIERAPLGHQNRRTIVGGKNNVEIHGFLIIFGASSATDANPETLLF